MTPLKRNTVNRATHNAMWTSRNVVRGSSTSVACVALVTVLATGCSTLPPGADFPKVASHALEHPEVTRLGGQFAEAARQHDGNSAYRIVSVGVDGFLIRAQMIDAAEKTLDLQYFIFHADETGGLLLEALRRAAARGVRVRVLIDDGATLAGDEQVNALGATTGIEVRVFNPFRYRGHSDARRAVEFAFNSSRLDYRMHNKLIVSDNSVALIGGRNISNPYFQMDPESQFADDDVFVGGPVAAKLSATFDEFWNSAFAIPAKALQSPDAAAAAPKHRHVHAREQLEPLQAPGVDYVGRLASGEPYAGLISGRLPLVWAPAQVVCDSPDKKNVESGARAGRLMLRPIEKSAVAVQSELLMVTPYFIPATDELQLLKDMRARNARVRILTNSLESNPDPAAHSGYARFRKPLLEEGVELYEVRSLLGNTKGSGQTAAVSSHGNYGLHAKLFVFDRQSIFIGSMNFDQRSKRLNTEIGLIIGSPELAGQVATRFDAMVQPEASYALALKRPAPGDSPRLVWTTRENGKSIEYTREPARSEWQRLSTGFLALLPLDEEL